MTSDTDEGPFLTVWITKYALTQGVFMSTVVDVEDGMVKVVDADVSTYFHGEGRDWHRTEENARKRFEEIKIAKLKSLNRQVKKIKALEFDIKP